MQNILVVDDNEDMLDAMEILITHFGFNVTVATSYESIIKTFDEYIPDAIVLDVILGNEDGREICKRIKSDVKTSNILIILISGQPEVLIDHFNFGADGILHKPFDIQKFKSLLRDFDQIIKDRMN